MELDGYAGIRRWDQNMSKPGFTLVLSFYIKIARIYRCSSPLKRQTVFLGIDP